MLNLGFFELTLFGIIALIVLGPDKLPVAARTLGKWYGNIRRMSARLQSEFVSELQLAEVTDELKSELAKMRESEAKMKAQMSELQRALDKTERTAHANRRRIADWVNTADTATPDTDGSAKPTQSNNPSDVALTAHNLTAHHMPMVNRWFLLGDYDKKRRLPSVPFLPNHQADPLLYIHHTNPQDHS